MNTLHLNSLEAALHGGDKSVTTPVLDSLPLMVGTRPAPSVERGQRRRFSATRQFSGDSGFKPFRVF